MPYFELDGLRLYFDEAGSGPPVLYLHGLLHRNWMQSRLAELASREFRAIALEFSGHGRSDAPTDPKHYSLARFAEEAHALLEHLDVEAALVHGTSLGANVALEMLVAHPERLAGAVVEMPVLAASYRFARTIFEPLATALEVGSPLVSGLARLLSPFPRSNPEIAILLDIVPKNPRQAAAVLRGLIESTPVPDYSRFGGVPVPTLVVGHPRDPLHSYEDAKALARTLPKGKLLTARSMLELRLRPARLWPEIESFYRECFSQARSERIS